MSSKATVQTKTNAPTKPTLGPTRSLARPFFGPEPLRESEPPDLTTQLANAQRLGHHFDAIPVLVGPEGGPAPPEVESTINRARGRGQPLHGAVQRQMSESMGHDFSGVRVHADSEADTLNRQLSAKAFTTGPDIFFKRGEYNPSSRVGRELIAHELSHVVQQSTGRVGAGRGMKVSSNGGYNEIEANNTMKKGDIGKDSSEPTTTSRPTYMNGNQNDRGMSRTGTTADGSQDTRLENDSNSACEGELNRRRITSTETKVEIQRFIDVTRVKTIPAKKVTDRTEKLLDRKEPELRALKNAHKTSDFTICVCPFEANGAYVQKQHTIYLREGMFTDEVWEKAGPGALAEQVLVHEASHWLYQYACSLGHQDHERSVEEALGYGRQWEIANKYKIKNLPKKKPYVTGMLKEKPYSFTDKVAKAAFENKAIDKAVKAIAEAVAKYNAKKFSEMKSLLVGQ